jgi:predicted dehydrogenase
MAMNRREFLQTAALASAATLPGFGSQRRLSANDRLALGVIGPGSRGQELIRQFLHVPNVEIAAVCDVYEPRFAQVNQIAGKTIPSHKDYRELLARTDLDAIAIASPPSFHAEHVLTAIQSGRPVYGEKILAFTPQDCQAVVDAVEKSGVLFQIGHQYRYAAWITESVARIHAGKIGEPTHVYAYWNRNNDWRRPVPSPDPGLELEHLINWRLYRESSGGLLTELGSHHIDIANWVFGEPPQSIFGTSSIVRYHDGRTVGDNVQAVLGYSQGRRLAFSSLTDNAQAGNQLWIYGTEGSVQITIEDATFYYEPKKRPAVAAQAEVVQRGIATGASYQTAGEMPYRGPGEKVAVANPEDPTLSACRSFVECVRSGRKPFADVRVGFGSGIACSTGRTALYEDHAEPIPQLVAAKA